MSSATPVIQTKLHLPFIRSETVIRQNLQTRVLEGLRGPLTLVTAPAGFGKTTLLASCFTAYENTTAWLSLERDDNQVERFLTYVIAALNGIDPTIGHDAATVITASGQPETEFIMTTLVNDLEGTDTKVVFVLDDYHVINNPDVHAVVGFLIEHCPANLHVVIASRSDPPLPLARLRARGQLVELRADDLSFNEDETAQFLNTIAGLNLDHRSIALLEQRTEGWIAGLQMAALAMRGHSDPHTFVEAFSGTNRYILDYLLEEVLSQQPSEIQRFLLYTSILERLSSPLCEAVLASNDVSHFEPLAYLERANLFLIPLDDERIWYRYHHLFADLLQARLQQTLSDNQIVTLHERAADWYEQNGFIYEAIYHASLTANNERVERLIEDNYMDMMQRGESLSIRFWTGKLDRELIYNRPLLCLHEAMSRAWFGQVDEADGFLTEAEKRLHSVDETPVTRFLLGYTSYIRSRVSAMRGEIHQSIQHGLVARQHVPANNHALHGGIGVILGYAYYLDGDFTNAIEVLSETIQSGVAARAVNSTVGAYCVLARLYALQGQLERSYELYQEAGAFITGVDGLHRGAMSVVDVGIADVLLERNDLDIAQTHLKQGLDNIQFWAKADDIALAYATQARLQHSKGNINAALATIEKAIQLIRSSGVFFEARQAVEVTKLRLWLAQGDHAAVRRWSKSYESNTSNSEGFAKELTDIMLARVYLTHDRPDDAIRLLSQLEAGASASGQQGRLIQILLLKALVLQSMNHSAQALDTLTQSLAFAEPEDYVRVFLDEGQPMQILLARWLSQYGDSPLRGYAARLLVQFDSEPYLAATDDSLSDNILVEPLTARELEVLHIMALGKTNQQIAKQLVVARGTVKAHTASIYRKLDVTNRTEAVARARELGMLP